MLTVAFYFILMLNVIKLMVVMLNVVAPFAKCLSRTMEHVKDDLFDSSDCCKFKPSLDSTDRPQLTTSPIWFKCDFQIW